MTMTRKDSEGVLLYDTYSSVKVPIDGKNIYNPFLGAYYGGKSVSSGSVYTRFNSNINLITHIPKLRLITTLTVQCVWLNRTRNLQADGVYILDDDNNPVYGDFSNGTNGKMIYRDPDFYMNMDGQLLPFNRDLYNDPTYGRAVRLRPLSKIRSSLISWPTSVLRKRSAGLPRFHSTPTTLRTRILKCC